MSETSNIQQAAGLIAGTVTAIAETADPTLVTKVQTVVSHGVSTFESHNPDLAPLVTTGTEVAETLAAKHGWAAVLDMLESFLGWHTTVPSKTVNVPQTGGGAGSGL